MEIGNTAITLREFNSRISKLLNVPATQNCWIVAEMSDVMVRAGHCYLELVEKDATQGTTVAKARGIIWANRFTELKYNFEAVTGQQFVSGLKVMVRVSANFHEQFGFSLVINDINPDFTLGDMARQRMEIIRRLTQEGIINMNRELELCDVPQRIAVISAAGAAGYGDFINQLHNNKNNIKFYTALFSATMQGANTVPSIIGALNRINEYIDLFDCVVIIRGGGATSELNSFDNYDLAANIAQFPIPVITGIGHERDNTVIDYVSHLRVKTPTAAAEWLIAKAQNALDTVNNLTEQILSKVKEYISGAKQQLAYFSSSIPLIAENKVSKSKSLIQQYGQAIPMCVQNRINNSRTILAHITSNIQLLATQRMSIENTKINNISEKINLLSPKNTLKRGYSITLCNGKAVTDATYLHEGDTITTTLYRSTIISNIKSIKE
ncbi:MAG: exodeoxyribonuclease VII large subunit [Muribaculaceae bacterium]